MIMLVMKRGAHAEALTFEGYNLPKLVRHKPVTMCVVTGDNGRERWVTNREGKRRRWRNCGLEYGRLHDGSSEAGG